MKRLLLLLITSWPNIYESKEPDVLSRIPNMNKFNIAEGGITATSPETYRLNVLLEPKWTLAKAGVSILDTEYPSDKSPSSPLCVA